MLKRVCIDYFILSFCLQCFDAIQWPSGGNPACKRPTVAITQKISLWSTQLHLSRAWERRLNKQNPRFCTVFALECYFSPGRGAKYCDQHVFVSLSVCVLTYLNKNSSGDEIANVNFLRRYGTYVLQNTKKENLLHLTN